MTETAETTSAPTVKKTGGLSSKLLPELKEIAGGLGIKGAGSMKKAQLVDAIRAAQSGGGSQGGGAPQAEASRSEAAEARRSEQDSPRQDAAAPDGSSDAQDEPRAAKDGGQQGNRQQGQGRNQQAGNRQQNQNQGNRQQGQNQGQNQSQGQGQGQGQGQAGHGGQEADGNRRSRRRRGRDRDRADFGGAPAGGRERQRPQDVEPVISEDDILVPVAGIVDILDNYAFVRTSGYLPGPNDVYVSLSMVRKYGLRKGDAVTGAVRQAREGERKEKFNPLVRLDTVNGGDVEAAKDRVDFNKLTPLYASERLRLETDANNMIGRVIDIAAPIGKGQRGLIVSPPKAGKTMIMQSIANSITSNNPEVHLMVVLVDERPEEVTDFQRTVKGEVIASTFDRPASDHTMVAELAIERAKRLVEMGHDVVVLLDGITRLGRAYNLAAPASGRILSGGVDSSALYPPKKFFGAARNIEDGGSLTILATALIETGSKMDEVIFEEFKGTGNMELRLRREFADKRLFPAIDAVQSGTRREELLMSKEELAIVWKLRRVLSGLDGQQALELLLERLKKSSSNIEFLMQVQKTTPGSNGDD
ncbi:MAG TPA: transcription termination factor Rho [Nocardioidaceae bacterium]|nr:transcription termination factor Rho [Nocardioidaceae bacterium]